MALQARLALPDVFTTAEAAQMGWTSPALRHAVHVGRVRRARKGVYSVERPATDRFGDSYRRRLHDAVAIAKSVRGCLPTHRSAALIHGLPDLGARSPCITVLPGHGHSHSRAHVHRAVIPANHQIVRTGCVTTTVARTVVDLAREHGTREAVVAGDAAIRKGLLDRRSAEAVLRDCRGWPGIRSARAALALFDGRSESVLESLSRLALVRRGFTLLVQPQICDEDGQFVARADFYIEELGVVGEADGLGKTSRPGYLEYELQRRQLIENLNFGFVRWQMSDLARFDLIAERIRHTGRYRRGPVRGIVRPAPALDW